MKRLLLLILGCYLIVHCHALQAHSLPNLGNADRNLMSQQDEQLIGKAWMQYLRGQGAIYPDPIVNDYLQNLGNKLSVHSNSLPSKLTFFGIYDHQINAFAFLGGHIAIYSGLILATRSESELAAVMAHEISHITQDHLIRQLAKQRRLLPITLTEALAAIALGSPDLMIAVLAGHQQQILNFSRSQEQEADRIGLSLLAKAGFDPHGMPQIFQQMKHLTRYHGKAPEYLLTHPLFESRIADARNRADFYTYQQTKNNFSFQLIRTRVEVFSADSPHHINEVFHHRLKTKKYQNLDATEYGHALSLIQVDKPKQAHQQLTSLARKYPDNLIIQLSLLDLELELNHPHGSELLHQLYQIYPSNRLILFYLAQYWLEKKKPHQAEAILEKYRQVSPDDLRVYQLQIKTQLELKQMWAMHEANANLHLLQGDLGSAMTQIELAIDKCTQDKYHPRLKAKQQEIEMYIKAQKKL